MSKKFMRIFLFILVSFAAFTALPYGFIMIYRPDGGVLGLTNEMLEGTPFKNFLLPGLTLAVLVGGLNLIGVFMLMARNTYSYRYSLFGGIVLAGWIVAQLMFLQYYHWLQGLFLVIGTLIILLSFQLMGKAAF